MSVNLKKLDLINLRQRIRDDHYNRLISKSYTDFGIEVENRNLSFNRFIVFVFMPYLMTKCLPNSIGIHITGAERAVIEVILSYCLFGKLFPEPNETNFYRVLETAYLLSNDHFVRQWLESYEQKIEDPINILMQRRQISQRFQWTDKVMEINDLLNQIKTAFSDEYFDSKSEDQMKGKKRFEDLKPIKVNAIQELIYEDESRPQKEELTKTVGKEDEMRAETQKIMKINSSEECDQKDELETGDEVTAQQNSSDSSNFYLFSEVFDDSEGDERQYVYQKDFTSYIYRSSDGIEWKLYRKFNNHFRITFTSFVSYNSQTLLIGALVKLEPKGPKTKVRFVANKNCMRYMRGTQFKTFPSLNTSRARHSVLVFQNQLFCIGGIEGMDKRNKDLVIINNSIEYFDQKQNQWTVSDRKLVLRVYSMGAVEYNNQIWIIGGMCYNDKKSLIPTDAIQVFDPNSNQKVIDSKEQRLPLASAFISAIVVRNKLFIIGGRVLIKDEKTKTESLAVTNNVWIYDLKSKSWSRGPPLTCARCKIATISRGSLIYAFGGVVDLMRISKKCSFIETLDCNHMSEGWIRHEDLPIEVSGNKVLFRSNN